MEPTPYTGDARIMADYAYWCARAEDHMWHARLYDDYCVLNQCRGDYPTAKLYAERAVRARKFYQWCIDNALACL